MVEKSALQMQMESLATRGRSSIWEHKGWSGIEYEKGQKVEAGKHAVTTNGEQLSMNYVESCVHTHRKTGIYRDGVLVELTMQSQEVIDAIEEDLDHL